MIKITSKEQTKKGFTITRRDFLKLVPPATAVILMEMYLPKEVLSFTYVEPIEHDLNPLESYPNRDWEGVYRDLYSYDSTFHYLCAPNDTHGCLLNAKMKNGVIKWIDPSFGYHKATDLYGNTATARWDPRICVSGVAYLRRFYAAERRVKGAFIRTGFKAWVDAGYPRDPDTGAMPIQYTVGRGKEDWLKVSWDEVFGIIARTMLNTVETYSGPDGAALLAKQGYDPAMIEAMKEAGTQTTKTRGGMPFLGVRRIISNYRFANGLALLDSYVRGVDPESALGGRGWDNYAWHTDLPSGHTMVMGNKTSDFDLYSVENAKVIVTWGKNMIVSKMVDSHWLTEARLHGAKVITIATEYQSTSNKADQVVILRPATDCALALGLAYVMIGEKIYDADYVKHSTDMPFLLRMDTLKLLRARDIIPDYTPAELTNYIKTLKPGEKPPSIARQGIQYVSEEIRNEWDDFVAWDLSTDSPQVVTRDDVGDHFSKLGINPALEGTYEITTVQGETVRVRPVFDVITEYLMDNCDVKTTSEITGVPEEGIISLAHTMAENLGSVLSITGMGPNQYWNADLKDRAIFLVAALTGNEGHFGGGVGSYAGNYRLEMFAGVPQFAVEDPFNIELDPTKPAKLKKYLKYESAHYYGYGDRPLRVNGKLFTGITHMSTPTKTCWWANTNSILGNAKWSYDIIMNTLPKIEMIINQEFHWTMTCEYSDIVLGVDSWPERKIPDIYGSSTNPFFQAAPDTPLPRMFDTKDDMEMQIGVAKKLAEITEDDRFLDYWKFAIDGNSDVYIDRIINASNGLKGYKFEDILESCKDGTPFYHMSRTSPRVVGWEQVNESKPWYSMTGRLEFYREEDEFIDAGENMPVWRETVDATFYEPAVISAKPGHPAIKPMGPEDYGIDLNDLSAETRQVRNVVKPWSEIKLTVHPLREQEYSHIMYTPKYRHACHTAASTPDIEAVYFGPFGDFYRHDIRKPHVSEGYVDLHPLDAKELGIDDGDYIWIDADPTDRPFRGWQEKPKDFKVMRWMARARYYPNIIRKTARAWFHMYQATHGSVQGHENRPDKLAKNPRTGYQALYRYGGHQSTVRAWLKPTLMTDSLVRNEYFGQVIGKGFEVDVHTANGAPKESFVKFTRAEAGEPDGQLWQPAAAGYRPTYENAEMKKFLRGDYITEG